MDDFLKDLNLATKSRDCIVNGLEERNQKNSLGQTDSYLDSKLRGWVSDFAVNFDSLQRQIENYKQNPERYKLTLKELERRSLLVDDLERDLNELESKVKSGNRPISSGIGVNFRRDGSEEADSTKNLSNRDLQQATNVMWKQQSELEDAILGTTENIVSISHNMKDELDLHDKLLSDTTQNMDHAQVRMDKANFRMKELIYKSSDCCLLTVILVLIGVIIVIIFFL